MSHLSRFACGLPPKNLARVVFLARPVQIDNRARLQEGQQSTAILMLLMHVVLPFSTNLQPLEEHHQFHSLFFAGGLKSKLSLNMHKDATRRNKKYK